MTAPGQYASQDGSFVKSAGGAAGRGVLLILAAVAIGAFLLSQGFDGAGTTVSAGSSEPASEPASDDGGSDGAADDATDDSGDSSGDADTTDGGGDAGADDAQSGDTGDQGTAEPATTNPPGEVKVAAVNGTGEPGLAGNASGILEAQGYVTAAKNAASVPTADSRVIYVAGYSEDAKAVASALGIPADLIVGGTAEEVLPLIGNSDNVSDFHIFVIQGTDRAAG